MKYIQEEWIFKKKCYDILQQIAKSSTSTIHMSQKSFIHKILFSDWQKFFKIHFHPVTEKKYIKVKNHHKN